MVIGLDYLSYPTGAIKQAQDLAAAAFGAEQSWFLVNGTTTGKLMTISYYACLGRRIILPRVTLHPLDPWAAIRAWHSVRHMMTDSSVLLGIAFL